MFWHEIKTCQKFHHEFSDASGYQGALAYKRTILKHCLLSYTLLLGELNGDIFDNETLAQSLENKGLARQDVEIASLKMISSKKWMKHWWVPLNWCCTMVEQERNSRVKEIKELGAKLVNFKESMDGLIRYRTNPFPALASQAVYFVTWAFTLSGAFALQPIVCMAPIQTEAQQRAAAMVNC